MTSLATPRLHLITDPSLGERLAGHLQRALAAVGAEGHAVAVHLRAKDWPTSRLLAAGRSLRQVTRAAGVRLLVNDRLDVAALIGADGVQLPELGAAPEDARAVLGDPCLVGASCHDRRGLEAAAEHGADFATLSPVFGVPQKAPPLGIDGFARLAKNPPLPTIALGGVGVQHVEPLLAAGASGVACIRAVMGAAAPHEVVRDMLRAGRPGSPD